MRLAVFLYVCFLISNRHTIIYGKGIKEGYQITDVMMQFDVAATIAEIFHLKRPQAWRGQPITSVFKGRR